MIKITFPDGSVREYAKGTTAYQIAESISPRLAADSLAAAVNGATVDMTRPIEEDASVKFYKWDDEEGKHAFWHTSSHLLAEALEALYPGIKFGIGPAIENGFYYDVDSPTPITEADLPTIENKMVELSRNKEALLRREVPKAEALKTFTEKGDQYKVELITDLEDGTISFYTNGAFTDLCRGPHIPNTGYIKALKLTSVAGAYWRGNEKNKMLTRIYGISFPKKSMLDEYLAMMEEAKKRDHRKLGKDLELFTFSQRVGQGLPLWLPKGAALRDRLEQFLRGVQKEYGYQQVITPHIGNKELYVTSGHYAKYGKDSFQPIHTPIEGEEYLLKPMNCPHHCEIYRSKPRSYKELPVRLAEFGTVYRYEQSGELHGLTRVRGFTQDDAHLFVRPDQLLEEFERVIDIVLYIFKTLKFDNYTAQISLRDPNNKEKYIGSDENWEKAESAIMQAAKEKGLNTVVELGEAYSGSKYPRPDAGSYLLLTFDGRALEVQENLNRVNELVLSQGALEVITLQDAAQAAEIWRVRGALVKAAEAVSEQEPMDIVVPISKTAEFIRFIHALEAKSGVRMIGFGHAGDGNVHLCVMRDGRDQETWDKLLHETAEQAYEEAYRLGGVASGEHGIGLSKRSYFLRQTQPEVLTAMNQIKNALDPKHILNDQKSYVKGETNHATTV